MKRKILENAAVAVVLGVFAFLICMLSSVNLWNLDTIYTDSGVFRYIALAMSKGEVMYRDCFDHKGPLLYFLNYLGMSISYYKGIWIIEVLFMLGTVWGVYKIARMFCGKVFSCITVFMVLTSIFDYFEYGNFTEEYAMPFILWSLYIFLDYFLNEKVSGLRICLCGIMFACVVMLRANMVAVWLVFCIAVLIQKVSQKKVKELPGFLGWFLLGCMIVSVPIVLYLCVNGAFEAFVQDYFLFNILYSACDMESLLLSYIIFLDSFWVLVSLGSIFYVFKVEQDRKKKYVYGIYFLFMCCSIMFTCMPGRDLLHYGMMLLPMFALPFSMILAYMAKLGEQNKVWYLIVYCCILLLLPPWMETLKNTVSACYHPREEFIVSADAAMCLDTILSNSSEEDRITVWGNTNSIYVHTGRLSASRYSYQYPLTEVDPEIYDEYFEDLEKHLPKLVVITPCDLEHGRMQNFLARHHYEMILDTENCLVYSGGQ